MLRQHYLVRGCVQKVQLCFKIVTEVCFLEKKFIFVNFKTSTQPISTLLYTQF